ncbi:DUF4307 domain-containing protein [Micrococcus sp.]|uniref:DUF4307 domain-containing protein n=1 Tax=Micrococcus sp. TaxID=1271 RepID=UPI002A90CC49|nr:DUF4307 domain-containing protein [Micrococcus sp.]MDY6055364.1 DUF4307 domain-containing protein [Micrococcus sp.]
MSTPADPAVHAQESTLANRYGRPRRHLLGRTGRRVLAGVALAAAVILAVVIALDHSVGRIQAKTVGYEILGDDDAQVTFTATVPAGTAVECDLVVLDAQAAPVGFRTVRLGAVAEQDRALPSDAEQRYTAHVRTVVRGVSGLVDVCRPA